MNNALFFVCFGIYMAIMITIGILVSRKQTGDDYLIGSQRLGVFLLLGTMIATQVGTGSSMGAAGFGYSNGWAGILYAIGGFFGIILVPLLFVNVRKYKFLTMAEELSFYYGGNKYLKSIVAILIYAASVGWLGAHLLGGSLYFSWVTGMALPTAKILTALGFGLYVIIGGYVAVVWTDAIQSIILFIGFIVVAILSLANVGGLSEIKTVLRDGSYSFLGIEKYGLMPAISLVVAIIVGGLAVPSFRQRLYSGKDIKTINKAFYGSGILYILFAFFPVILGMSARVSNAGLDNNNFAIPYMAMHVLPLGFGILILIAGLSATMSSGDSDAITGVSILMIDIYPMVFKRAVAEDKKVHHSRIATALTLGLALFFSLTAEDITSYITSMISTTLTGLAVAAIFGKFWKRATWQGGIAALLGGSIVSILSENNATLMNNIGNPAIPALLGASIACIIVSMITPKNTVSEDESLQKVLAARRVIQG